MRKLIVSPRKSLYVVRWVCYTPVDPLATLTFSIYYIPVNLLVKQKRTMLPKIQDLV